MSRTSAGTRPRMTNSPIELQKYLSGIEYPTDKQTLVDTAKGNGATNDVVQTLQGLPSDRFTSPADVSKAFGQE
jgi:hypothetical protein